MKSASENQPAGFVTEAGSAGPDGSAPFGADETFGFGETAEALEDAADETCGAADEFCDAGGRAEEGAREPEKRFITAVVPFATAVSKSTRQKKAAARRRKSFPRLLFRRNTFSLTGCFTIPGSFPSHCVCGSELNFILFVFIILQSYVS